MDSADGDKVPDQEFGGSEHSTHKLRRDPVPIICTGADHSVVSAMAFAVRESAIENSASSPFRVVWTMAASNRPSIASGGSLILKFAFAHTIHLEPVIFAPICFVTRCCPERDQVRSSSDWRDQE
jgi:hypothetical protein